MQTKSLKKSVKTAIIMLAAILIFNSPVCTYAQNVNIRKHLPSRTAIRKAHLQEHITHLCHEYFEGRATGTKGNALAALYLQSEFEKAGLMKMGESYSSPFLTDGTKTGRNIIGMLPGKDSATDRYVIVGAHYDHLGTLGKRLYPGADSNASGVTALLSLAQMMSISKMEGNTYDCNIIFVAFDAREMSMAGSQALWSLIENGRLKDPQSGMHITKDEITLMVNIDQIGCTLSPLKSGRRDYIIMLGNQSLRPSSRNILKECNSRYAIDMDIDYTYYGSQKFTNMFYRLSDQRTFIDKGIPSVLFTSGITMNTNRTYDTPETIDYEILQKRIFLIYHWLDELLHSSFASEKLLIY